MEKRNQEEEEKKKIIYLEKELENGKSRMDSTVSRTNEVIATLKSNMEQEKEWRHHQIKGIAALDEMPADLRKKFASRWFNLAERERQKADEHHRVLAEMPATETETEVGYEVKPLSECP